MTSLPPIPASTKSPQSTTRSRGRAPAGGSSYGDGVAGRYPPDLDVPAAANQVPLSSISPSSSSASCCPVR